MNIKKWFSLALALCLLLGAMPAVLAEDVEIVPGEALEAAVSDSEATPSDPAQGAAPPPLSGEANPSDPAQGAAPPPLSGEANPSAPAGAGEAVSNAVASNADGAGVPITEANFPDAGFRGYLLSGSCDYNGDGCLSDLEAQCLNVGGMMIQSLKGIELLPSLEELYCSGNQLTGLDLSANSNLEFLSCDGNQLQSLNLSQNAKLARLNCTGNQLTALDLSGCTALAYLNCADNQLTALDLSGNPSLVNLYCNGNRLTALDVSGKAGLESLFCNDNQLSQLSINGCTGLRQVTCDGNALTTLDLSSFRPDIQALFTDANTEIDGDTMRIGDGACFVACDNYVELTMNGQILRPLNVKEISFPGGDNWDDPIVLNLGDTCQLKPEFTPANASPALTYQSEGDSLTVSGTGKVTAKKYGTGTITVTADNGRSACVYFNVPGPEEMWVEGFPDTLGVGETFTPVISVDPEGVKVTPTWKTSNSKIASVNKKTGKITAKKTGNVRITVSATDNWCTARYSLSVVAAPKSVTIYKGSKAQKKTQTLTLKKGKTLQLSARTDNRCGESSLKWSSSNKKVATVSSTGKVKAVKKGTATITVTTYNKKKMTIKIKVN